jgi:hypothetical protein
VKRRGKSLCSLWGHLFRKGILFWTNLVEGFPAWRMKAALFARKNVRSSGMALALEDV